MKKGFACIILVCICLILIFIYCLKDTKEYGNKKETPISTLEQAVTSNVKAEPLHSIEPQQGELIVTEFAENSGEDIKGSFINESIINESIINDTNISESSINEDHFLSESSDKKVRVEFIVNNSDIGSLDLVDIENSTTLISYEFPSDTKFFPIWNDDDSYVALGYKNKYESRTFILLTNIDSSTIGKQIISHELSYFADFVDSSHQEDADGHIIPVQFIDGDKLLLSVDWIDKDGKRVTKTTEWDFKNGTTTDLK
jgi:hypothetical protein